MIAPGVARELARQREAAIVRELERPRVLELDRRDAQQQRGDAHEPVP